MNDITHVREILAAADPARGLDPAPDEPALTRILTSGKKSRRWSRWTVALGTVLAVGAAGAAADASGLIPTGVIKKLTISDDPGNVWGDVNTAKAELVIETEGPDSVRVQWWVAPGHKGGGCRYMRTLTPGKKEDGSVECHGAPPRWTGPKPETRCGEMAARTGVIGYSPAPATQVKVTFTDGTGDLVEVHKDGYYMAIFNRTPANDQTVEITALDARGHVLSTNEAPCGTI